jgi:D-amino-acid oxidase
MSRITVVGAGVVGLSCAVRIAETGRQVDVLARDLPLETTSAVAGGLWMPYLAEPVDAVVRWARATFHEFARLAEHPADADHGVRMMTGTLVREPTEQAPSWAAALADLAPAQALNSPPATAPGAGRAWRFRMPLIDTRRYLQYLRRRLLAADGTLTRMSLPALPSQGLVLNCTGLSAHALAADPSVRPVRGQVVLLEDPGLTEWIVDEREQDDVISYVLPHGRHVVVGGTSQDGDWSTAVRPATADALLRRARQLVPELRAARVIGHRVGLRPARPAVRLQVERTTGRDGEPRAVVHCYGHGGAGITLAWGCAADVLDLVLAEQPVTTADR